MIDGWENAVLALPRLAQVNAAFSKMPEAIPPFTL
jgi:hypothetical protein